MRDEPPLLKAFFHDGSLRDVPVGGTREQFVALCRALHAEGWTLPTHAGPLDVDALPELPAGEDGVVRIAASKEGLQANLWGWPSREAEFFGEIDLAPWEVNACNIAAAEQVLVLLAG